MGKSAEARVQEIDAAAFHLLNADFSGVTAFSDGANALCEKTVGISRDALLQCRRLRLVARLAKVLRLLSQPGERLCNAARDWARTPNIDALLELRDIGLEEGPALRAANPDQLQHEVFQAARKLSREMLPKHVEEDPIEVSPRDSQASTVPGEACRPSKQGVQGDGAAEQRPSRGGPNIFDAPLIGELPAFEDGLPGRRSNKRVHSFAQMLEGDSFVAQGAWTEGEEQRLLEGFQVYGKQWNMISKCCGLQHRTVLGFGV
ncbi:unnamed protein product [Symbiodinium sp. CCMP2456]|nr:unnamed protein product [Symbiodinium sp. CCMP2456]